MWGALLLIGVVFTLEHTAGGWSWSRSLLGPPAGALLFGMAALATRGIAVPLGIHAAFNFGQSLMGQKDIAGMWKPVVDTGFDRQADTLGYIGYLVGMLLTVSGFWLWKEQRS
jgi:membrane protease YdiL (CAAX protease family)